MVIFHSYVSVPEGTGMKQLWPLSTNHCIFRTLKMRIPQGHERPMDSVQVSYIITVQSSQGLAEQTPETIPKTHGRYGSSCDFRTGHRGDTSGSENGQFDEIQAAWPSFAASHWEVPNGIQRTIAALALNQVSEWLVLLVLTIW